MDMYHLALNTVKLLSYPMPPDTTIYGAFTLNMDEQKFEVVMITLQQFNEIQEIWYNLPSEIEYKRQEVIKNGK